MAYELSCGLNLGAANTGLSLEAQLVNTAGANVGAAITTGFVEYGATGNYSWFTNAMPDDHRGGVVFQVSPGGAIKTFVAINEQEVENSDLKTSTRASQTSVDDLPTNAELATALAAADDATLAAIAALNNLSQAQAQTAAAAALTAYDPPTHAEVVSEINDVQTDVAGVPAAVWASGTRTLTSFGTLVADTATAVWASGTRTLTSFGTLVADVATAVWAAVTRTLTSAAPPTAAVIADAVWDEVLAGHLTGGSTGEALDNAGSGASPAAIADAVWDEARADHLQLGSFGIADQVVTDGQAQGGGASTITLAAGASAVNNFYTDDILFIKVGTGAGQVNIVDSYVGATKVATMLKPWVVTPDATSCYVILPLALIPGASNLSAADIWTYVSRTLTQSIAAVDPPPVISGSTLTIIQGDTMVLNFTGLGNLTGRSKLWFAIKDDPDDADTASIVSIEETAGLVRLNGAAGTAGHGSIVVTDQATGAITVTLDEAATAGLTRKRGRFYSVKSLTAGVTTTRTRGSADVTWSATKAVV